MVAAIFLIQLPSSGVVAIATYQTVAYNGTFLILGLVGLAVGRTRPDSHSPKVTRGREVRHLSSRDGNNSWRSVRGVQTENSSRDHHAPDAMTRPRPTTPRLLLRLGDRLLRWTRCCPLQRSRTWRLAGRRQRRGGHSGGATKLGRHSNHQPRRGWFVGETQPDTCVPRRPVADRQGSSVPGEPRRCPRRTPRWRPVHPST